MDNRKIFQAYEMAKKKYAELGVDVDTALENLSQISLSIHCWQGDDVGGFEKSESELSGGGSRLLVIIQVKQEMLMNLEMTWRKFIP